MSEYSSLKSEYEAMFASEVEGTSCSSSCSSCYSCGDGCTDGGGE